ncbi:MAG: serine/threonine protein kinase [Planctomycetales bacterium]|nr:serine/threonine protein kinase [Planctomycetales bacterium]
MPCLTPEEITEYLHGQLQEGRSDDIERHLNRCDRCEQVARSLENHSDSLVNHLRLSSSGPDADDPAVGDKEWDGCLEALRSIPQRSGPQRTGEPSELAESMSLEQAIRPESVYHYRLGNQLGRGGMGVVYRSWHPQLHRPVAIKILSAARMADANSIVRFQREMRAAGGLDHPGIVRAVDAGLWQGTYYLVMEFIDGIDLSRLANRCGPLRVADACAMIIEAAEAIQFAHEHQIIHRDIKPSNLMLTRQGTIKILDFGLARLEHGGLVSNDATTAGRLIGTLDYLAPEQAAGAHQIDVRSDVYGLGATLYRLLAGRPPHGTSQRRPILQYLQKLTGEAPVPIENFRKDLSTKLSQLITKLLSRDPHQRPSTAAEVAQSLRPFASESDLRILVDQSLDSEQELSNDLSLSVNLSSAAASNDQPDLSRRDDAFPKTRISPNRLFGGWQVAILLLLVGLSGGWAAVTLWMKTGEATVEIQSEVDDITLELIKEGRVSNEIEIHTGSQISRIRVGKYELRVAGESDHVRVDQKGFSLMRGDQRIVRITREGTNPSDVGVPEEPNRTDAATNAEVETAQTMIDSLRDKLGDEAPAVIEAIRIRDAADQEIMRIAMGEDTKARTSRGRTYRQWSDIVLRETDPSTVIDAIDALASLSVPETHADTFQTLMKVAQWNESRGSEFACDDYISYLTNKKVQEDPQPADFRGRRSAPERDYTWERLYPPVSDDWRGVVDAILAAIAKLPDDAIDPIDATINSASDAAKRIRLVEAAKDHHKDNEQRNRLLAQRLCRSDQPAQVRALANHIWLESLKGPVGNEQSEALASDSEPLTKAVVATLLSQQRCPLGREMGTVCGRFILADGNGFGPLIRRIALRMVNEGESFRSTQEFQFLQSLGGEIAKQWNDQKPSLTGRLMGVDYMEMLASADLLNSATQKSASDFLHTLLEEQLRSRQSIDDPSVFDESTMWMMPNVQALAAIDGALPAELDRYKIQDGSKQALAFKQWSDLFRAGDQDAERWMSIWLLQFPIETIGVVSDVVADGIRSQSVDQSMRSRMMQRSARTSEAQYLSNVPLGIVVPYAAQHLDDENVLQALGAMLEVFSNRGLDEIQLTVPLRSHVDSFLKMADANSLGSMRGLALRLAQLGGADDDAIAQLALKRITAKRSVGEKDRWDAASLELASLMECLANCESLNLSHQQMTSIYDRLMTTSFASFGGDETGFDRCLIAALGLSKYAPGPDPRVIRVGLGIHVAGFSANGGSSRGFRSRTPSAEDLIWRNLTPGVSTEVFKQTLQTLAEFPLADQEILASLYTISRRVSQSSRFDSDPDRLISNAIAAVEKAIGQSETPPTEEAPAR